MSDPLKAGVYVKGVSILDVSLASVSECEREWTEKLATGGLSLSGEDILVRAYRYVK